MAEGLTLNGLRLKDGVWQGLLAGPAGTMPELRATHQGRVLEGVTVTAMEGQPGQWTVRVPVPAEILSDGVQTIVIADAGGAPLGSAVLIAGEPLEDDLRAEIDLLRAELDLLKRAFRRHCAETG